MKRKLSRRNVAAEATAIRCERLVRIAFQREPTTAEIGTLDKASKHKQLWATNA
jgi:hypothetical protein